MISNKEEQEEFHNKLNDCKSKGHDVYTEVSTGAYIPFNKSLMLGFLACCRECNWASHIKVL